MPTIRTNGATYAQEPGVDAYMGLRKGRQGSDIGSETERGWGSHSRSDPSSTQTQDGGGESGNLGPNQGSLETLDPLPVMPYWSAKRHLTCGNPTPQPPSSIDLIPWRGSAPWKLKTANAALVLCLNIDVDPPDIIKTNPCAILECWVDPHTMPSNKALEAIGTNLQQQFEGLSTKIPYKPVLDPSYEDLRRYCMTLRKQAKEDMAVLYYNGHGVPKPTPSGELWCFNKNYTQYIPVSLMEVQNWLGSPGVYIWDCSAAGNLLQNFNNFAERRDQEINLTRGGYPEGFQPFMNSLQLAACAAHEQLPSCPELPADLFTSCLTSPIDIALRYFVMNHQLPNNISAEMVSQLPGDLKDRRTPLGELNWIFTAITDTIAWTSFSRDVFTRLYRSDLLIASLFRNFLLAERIMKNYHCTPHTHPPLPATNTHPMWAAWDLAVDTCLRQLPDLIGAGSDGSQTNQISSAAVKARKQVQAAQKEKPKSTNAKGEKPYVYVPSRFFADQLTAFEVWISRGGSALTKRGPMSFPLQNGDGSPKSNGHVNNKTVDNYLVPRKPPDQLPIVLQVLLSQPHRLRALILLSQFLDLGPWAVHLVLSIGIFPYVSKLLQAAGPDLRPVLIFIWARILAVDPTVQVDLYNTTGFKYFANVLAVQDDPNHLVLPNASEHKAMCAFILSAIARDFPHGQVACWHERVFDNCFERLDEGDFLLRQWSALCIGQIWDGNDEIKVYGVDRGTQDKLIALLSDDSPEVRAAALFALGTFMGANGALDVNKRGGRGSGTMYQLEERIHFRMEVAVATGATLAIKDDASPMVRKELLVLVSSLVKEWRGYFVVCAWIYWEEDRRRAGSGSPLLQDEDITVQAVADWLDNFGDDDAAREENRVLLSSFFTIFVVLLELSVDPYLEVATNAQTIVDYILALLLESPFTRLESTTLQIPSVTSSDARTPQLGSIRSRVPSPQPSSPGIIRPSLSRSDTMTSTISTGVSNTLKRTSSFANALKNLAGTIAFPSTEEIRSSANAGLNHFSPRSDMGDASRPPSPNLNIAQYASPYSRPPTPQAGASASSRNTSPRSSHEAPLHRPMDCEPSDVMEALMEEDMERLRARRRAGTRTNRGLGSLPSPNSSTFSMDSNNSSIILGMGTGAGIRDILPLKSTFFDWCCEYFKEPQMRQAEPDEPGSIQYNYQVWRQQRNEQIVAEIETQAEVAQNSRWDKYVTKIQIQGHPLSLAFHAYDNHLVIANESDMISVWDWSLKKRLNYFCNGNPKSTSITALQIINQDVGGIIMTGSADGVIRLYRNYDPATGQGPVQLVSAFRGLSEVIQMKKGSGVVMDWKQSGGSLLVGGDSKIIRVWDAHTETQVLDLDTNTDSPVTAIMSDHGTSTTFVASFADGEVKVFDRRLEEEDAVVRSYVDHGSWVQNVRWHPTLPGQFLSASLDGEVKLWDLRGSDGAVQTWNIHPNGLSAFDVHPQTGAFAATSAITPTHWRDQRVMVQSLSRSVPLSNFSIPTGISSLSLSARGGSAPSPYIPRSSSLAFHPIEMLYGVGGPDGIVRILGCKFT